MDLLQKFGCVFGAIMATIIAFVIGYTIYYKAIEMKDDLSNRLWRWRKRRAYRKECGKYLPCYCPITGQWIPWRVIDRKFLRYSIVDGKKEYANIPPYLTAAIISRATKTDPEFIRYEWTYLEEEKAVVFKKEFHRTLHTADTCEEKKFWVSGAWVYDENPHLKKP